MRTALLAFLLLPLSAFAAEDNYECTLDFAELDSLLNSNAPGVTVISPEMRDKKERRIHEKLQVASGMQIELSVGGCAHYGYTLTFTHIPGVAPTKHPNFEQIKRAIPQAPLKDDAIDDMNERILHTQRLPEDGSIECGDATCYVETKPGSFSFTYDFAL